MMASEIQYPAQPTAPALSEAALTDYRRVLANPDFQRDHPERYASLKQSVAGALAVTGQQLDKPPVLPGPQQHHEQQYGIAVHRPAEYGVAADSPITGDDLAKLKVDPLLGKVIAADMAASPKPDPAKVKEAVELAGSMSYADGIADVQKLLDTAGVKVKATAFPPHSLMQLAAWTRHYAKMLATRPKG
jgi:hypothetical protein